MLIVAGAGGKLPRWLIDIHPESAATAGELFEAAAPPPLPSSRPRREPASEAPRRSRPLDTHPGQRATAPASASDDDDDAKSAAKPGDGKKPTAAARSPARNPASVSTGQTESGLEVPAAVTPAQSMWASNDGWGWQAITPIVRFDMRLASDGIHSLWRSLGQPHRGVGKCRYRCLSEVLRR